MSPLLRRTLLLLLLGVGVATCGSLLWMDPIAASGAFQEAVDPQTTL